MDIVAASASSTTMNQKNLNYEIETTELSNRSDQTSSDPMNQKNLNYEIEKHWPIWLVEAAKARL